MWVYNSIAPPLSLPHTQHAPLTSAKFLISSNVWFVSVHTVRLYVVVAVSECCWCSMCIQCNVSPTLWCFVHCLYWYTTSAPPCIPHRRSNMRSLCFSTYSCSTIFSALSDFHIYTPSVFARWAKWDTGSSFLNISTFISFPCLLDGRSGIPARVSSTSGAFCPIRLPYCAPSAKSSDRWRRLFDWKANWYRPAVRSIRWVSVHVYVVLVFFCRTYLFHRCCCQLFAMLW